MKPPNSRVKELPFGLEGKIYRSPMPFSAYDPLNEAWQAYQDLGVNTVVVLTEPQEHLVHARRDLLAAYRAAGMEAIHLPVQDFHVPKDVRAFNTALDNVENALREGQNVAVHCLAGLGRTGTFLACLAKNILNLEGRAAIDWVRSYVPGALENPAQETFVVDFRSTKARNP